MMMEKVAQEGVDMELTMMMEKVAQVEEGVEKGAEIEN